MKKILIVDDDDGVRTTLSELLREVGYTACEVSSGETALEAVSFKDFDVILLDITMPMMSGIEVLSNLKKIKPKTPVIMITGIPSSESASDAEKRGASYYIAKPFKVGELTAAISRAIENQIA